MKTTPTYDRDLDAALQAVPGIEALRGCSALVAGATGLIGAFLVEMLMRLNERGAGIAIYAMGRSHARLAERFPEAVEHGVHLVEQDITRGLSLEHEVDYIVHAASDAHPAAFNQTPVETMMSNLLGTKNILDFAREHGTKRVLYVSSGEVYGQGNLLLDAFDELYSGYVDPTLPRSCYPCAKRAAETLCVSYMKEYGVDAVIARPCHTYGPYTRAVDNRANVQFVKNVLEGQDILMKSAGTQMRSYCYVADCGSALFTILLKGKGGEAYNTANPSARITIAGFARTVAELSGRKLVFAEPDAVAMAERSPIAKQVLDTTKLEALGWRGLYPVEKGVAHTLAVLRGE